MNNMEYQQDNDVNFHYGDEIVSYELPTEQTYKLAGHDILLYDFEPNEINEDENLYACAGSYNGLDIFHLIVDVKKHDGTVQRIDEVIDVNLSVNELQDKLVRNYEAQSKVKYYINSNIKQLKMAKTNRIHLMKLVNHQKSLLRRLVSMRSNLLTFLVLENESRNQAS